MRPPMDLTGAFRPRPRTADKYSVGTVSVAGGSRSFPNAPVIAALGARAAGAGLVRLFAPTLSLAAAGALVPEATFVRLSAAAVPPRADVTAVGMGLGVSESSEAILSGLLSRGGRFVIDADALTILAKWRGGGAGLPSSDVEIVLTPHEGEAARLLGVERADVSADRLSAAKEIASRYGATVVLKGPGTLVVRPDSTQVYENATGNPFMALGGMGDLLAGVIAARWAYLKGDAFTAASSAAWLHGAAADCVVDEGLDMSLANVAEAIGSIRIALDGSMAETLNKRGG